MAKVVMFMCALSLSSGLVLAEDMGKKGMQMKMPNMTTEQRQKMANTHEKMAVCLRADKPLVDCHDEMMTACKENMGKEGCPMMDGKGWGMHHKK